jgi:multidrug efflux system membrane fusion protein
MREPNPLLPSIPPEAAKPGETKSRRPAKWALAAGALLIVVGLVWLVFHRHAAAGKTMASAADAGNPPVPVVAQAVVQKDVPIYLDGLGTVQAFNTVTIHVQVDGQLKQVNFVEGQFVHAGDLLAQIDPAPLQAALDQAAAKKNQDQAQLNLQQIELKREADLLAAKIDSQDAYDQVAAQVRELEAAVKADEAAMESAQVQLNFTKITAPLDGLIGVRLVDQGNIVHTTDANGLAVITQMRPISVVFTLPEQNLGEIQEQESGGQLTVLATDRDNRTVLDKGELAVINNQIDTTTGTIRLKATFPNEKSRLWPGQFVNTRLRLTTRKNGIVVPEAVIQRGPNGPFAFVIDAKGTAQVRPVKVAQMQDGQALIDEGLEPGELVVVDGQYKLQTGSKVKINQPGRAGKKAAGAGESAP